MEKVRQPSNVRKSAKNISGKLSGKKNPQSKKQSNLLIKKFFKEDHKTQLTKSISTLIKDQIPLQVQKKIDLSPLPKNHNSNEKTEKKIVTNSMTQPNNSRTVPKRKRELKSLGSHSKRNQYVYVFNPQTQNMTKYLIHQTQDTVLQLNDKLEYVPPMQSCDEDCQSNDEVVHKGVQHSKKDLFAAIQYRKLHSKHRNLRSRILSDSQTDSESYSTTK